MVYDPVGLENHFARPFAISNGLNPPNGARLLQPILKCKVFDGVFLGEGILVQSSQFRVQRAECGMRKDRIKGHGARVIKQFRVCRLQF